MYKLSQEQKALIKNDKPNKKLWDEAMESLSLGPVRMVVNVVKSPAGFCYAYAYAYAYVWGKLAMFVLYPGG